MRNPTPHLDGEPCEVVHSSSKPTVPESDSLSLPALVDFVLTDQPQHALPTHIDGVLVGRIVTLDAPDAPHVIFPHAPPEGLPARAMLPLTQADIGRDVALMFEAGNPRRPIVMGRMATAVAEEKPPVIEAEVDDRRIEIEAQEQLVLRCGESSITLTRSGKIIIRGTYVLTRSSGVNRIQGGSVEIN